MDVDAQPPPMCSLLLSQCWGPARRHELGSLSLGRKGELSVASEGQGTIGGLGFRKWGVGP